jgi:sugar phosphate isomerase/epimerase
MKNNKLSRRKFIGSSTVAATGALFLSKTSFAHNVLKGANKPNSLINGVLIGVTTYSYRGLPGTAEDMLKYCLACNISGVELRGDAAELSAGAPQRQAGQDVKEYNKNLAQWRATVSMDRFKAMRKMYNDAGVSIYAYKPLALAINNTDEEIEYAFRAGRELGVTQITVEHPDNDDQTKRIGSFADKYKIRVGYHAHTQATPTLWDTAMSQSEYNCINLDIGHYVAGNSASPVPFIEKNHARITSIHLKDRKFNNGPNTAWGQGDTPIKEVLELMRKNHYKFPATIELEYKIPEGSDPVKEVMKCREYAANVLKA